MRVRLTLPDAGGNNTEVYPSVEAARARIAELQERVQFISQIEFETPPIPRPDKPRDTDSVQIVAYHRIVKFRQCLDEALGSNNNRFWGVYRNVSWASGVIDFQLVEQGGLRAARPR